MTRELYIIYLVLKNYGKSPVVEIIKTVVVGALSVLSEVAGLTEREFENIKSVVKTVVAEMRVMCFKMEFSE